MRAITCFAVCLLASLLAACVSRAPLIPANLGTGSSLSVELDATPFFPQTEYQCGPAALATVLGASGVNVTPEALVPLVYLPARKGSLQVEMQAAPRKYSRLTYPLEPNLDAIFAELSAGRPVLVLHNYGLPLIPRWHYAVVVGYDSATDQMTLRSGTTRSQVLSARNFMRAWDNGGRWAMVVLKPGESAATAVPAKYLELASQFERVGTPQESRLVFDTAVKRWPTESLAWTGRGTAAYRSGDFEQAARDYAAAIRIDTSNVGARNNLAMTLLDLGCPVRAADQLRQIGVETLLPPLREAVLDTRLKVEAALEASDGSDSATCRAPPG
jgi:tetratricopeptide (TPR) repeat protein